jgi:hypothetical protein
MEWIEKYPNKSCDWGQHGISSNPNLTLEGIKKYPDKPWEWGQFGISWNSFANCKQKFIRKKHCEWFQSNIFEELVSVVFHPSCCEYNIE